MAVPDRANANNTRQSEQIVLNKSQDDKYDVLATELVAENEAGNALIRAKADDSGNLKVNVAAGDVTLNASDIQIGAVEIKDGDSDTRLDVESDGTKNAAFIQANALPLPTGAATSANQLPDNHQVTVSNQITQPTTPSDTQPVSGTVTVANPTADPETGLAKDTTLTGGTQQTKLTDGTDVMTIGSVTAKTGTVSAGGDTTILSVAGGTYVKLYHISFVPTTSSSTDRDVVLKIGSNSLMGWRTNTNGGGFSHSPKNGLAWFEGADGEDVVLNLSGSDSIRYNITYEIV